MFSFYWLRNLPGIITSMHFCFAASYTCNKEQIACKGIGYPITPTFFYLNKSSINLRTKLITIHMHTENHDVFLSRTSMQTLTPLINPPWLQRIVNLQEVPCIPLKNPNKKTNQNTKKTPQTKPPIKIPTTAGKIIPLKTFSETSFFTSTDGEKQDLS